MSFQINLFKDKEIIVGRHINFNFCCKFKFKARKHAWLCSGKLWVECRQLCGGGLIDYTVSYLGQVIVIVRSRSLTISGVMVIS